MSSSPLPDLPPELLERMAAMLSEAEGERQPRRRFPISGCAMVLASSVLAIGAVYGFVLLVLDLV